MYVLLAAQTHNHYDRHIHALSFPLSCRSYTRINAHSDALACNRVVKVMYMFFKHV